MPRPSSFRCWHLFVKVTLINTDLSDKSPFLDWVEIETTTSYLTVNSPMDIDGGTSSVLDGTTTRPADRYYIPVIVNASTTSVHHTTIQYNMSTNKWILVTDVKQKYRIIFYKVPRRS